VIRKFGISDKVDYISTSGEAFLENIEGKEYPTLGA